MVLFRNTAGLLCLILLVYSCRFKSDKNNPAIRSTAVNSGAIPNAPIENFDAFFKKYQTDSAFQVSRTVIPLKYIVTGDEGERDTTKYIPKNQLGFNRVFISNKEKMILKVTQGKSKAKVRFQIEDTGVENDFMFELKGGKWYLASVIDNSD